MILISELGSYTYSTNLNSVPQMAVNGDRIYISQTNATLVTEANAEAALARFNDVVDAITEDIKIYDTRKEVGYWKPKKPGPKPKTTAKAKEPASREHHEPAPKK